MFVSEGSKSGEIRNVTSRVTNRFAIKTFRSFVNRGFEIGGLVPDDELEFDVETLEEMSELIE